MTTWQHNTTQLKIIIALIVILKLLIWRHSSTSQFKTNKYRKLKTHSDYWSREWIRNLKQEMIMNSPTNSECHNKTINSKSHSSNRNLVIKNNKIMSKIMNMFIQRPYKLIEINRIMGMKTKGISHRLISHNPIWTTKENNNSGTMHSKMKIFL